MVWPNISISSALRTTTSWVWPPLTVRHRNGKFGFGSWMKCARMCARMWFTASSGLPKAKARLLANRLPTNKEPSRPGPCVTATASRSFFSIPAWRKAAVTTGSKCCWWAREASSGTTPPYCSCTAWPATTLLSSCPLRNTAAPVSSQLDSMARRVRDMIIKLESVEPVKASHCCWHQTGPYPLFFQ
jgi:hypothetical protein